MRPLHILLLACWTAHAHSKLTRETPEIAFNAIWGRRGGAAASRGRDMLSTLCGGAAAGRAAIVTGGTRGIGRGIAIPHGKHDRLTGLIGVFARIDKAIDFDAVDDCINVVFVKWIYYRIVYGSPSFFVATTW